MLYTGEETSFLLNGIASKSLYHFADFSRLLTWMKTLFTLHPIGEEIEFLDIPPFHYIQCSKFDENGENPLKVLWGISFAVRKFFEIE
ncbi:hypothetical protein [Peribacillus deserti]|uniref:hypothetical protein n=1 Tax=Peribacillus deserti TaxID=673318 RepID=UPI002152258E|nr:hypothetical protein [Peribacillus deserti]